MILKNDIIKKYENDNGFINFIKDYFKIYDFKTDENISFNLFDQQKQLLHTIENNPYIVCKKSRQVGATKTLCAWLLCKALFSKEGETFVHVDVNNLSSIDANKCIMEFIKQLPLYVFDNITLPVIKKFNKNEIVFSNNSKILFKTIDNIRTDLCGISNIEVLIFSEIAFSENNKKVIHSFVDIRNMLCSCSKIIIISTPNGKDNLFYFLYKNNPTFSLEWFNDPRYNKGLLWIRDDDILMRTNNNYEELINDNWHPISPWYIKMCKSFNNDKTKITQEIDGCFI